MASIHSWMSTINWNWTQIKLNSSLSGMNDSRANTSLYFLLSLSVSKLFRTVHWDQTMIIVCQSLGSRPILVQELFTLVPRLFGTASRCLSVQPFQLLHLRNIWTHLFDLAFPHRYRHSQWPVDVTELFPRFCCWTLIWLSRQWAWLCRGYWRYRSLIDWLIELTQQSLLGILG